MARVIMALLCALLLTATAAADVFEATCRISRQGSMGTGIAFEYGVDETVRVLTNKHVVGGAREVTLEFWRDGHQSIKVSGTVVWESYLPQPQWRDMAIVSVPLQQFGGLIPEVIPLAPRGSDPGPGQAVTSCGCPGGAWATAWRGHVADVSGPLLIFRPQPAPGRSGSAILSADGSQIIGLIAWGDGGVGLAMSLEEIYRAFEGLDPVQAQHSAALVNVTTLGEELPVPGAQTRLTPLMVASTSSLYEAQQCGPGQQCPPSFGSVQQPPMQPIQKPNSGGAFPTYPYAAPNAPAAQPREEYATKKDLAAIAERVDTLAGSIDTRHAELTSQVQQLGTDMRGELDVRLTAVEGAALSAAKAHADEAVTKAVSYVEKNNTTLLAHVNAIGTRQDITAHEAARSAVAAKIQELDFFSMGKVIAGALGVSGAPALAIMIGSWLIGRRLRPVITKATKNTSDAPSEGASRPFRRRSADRRGSQSAARQ